MTEPRGDRAFRTTENKGRGPEMTYAGALSFLHRRYTRDLSSVDVAVSGIKSSSTVPSPIAPAPAWVRRPFAPPRCSWRS